MSVRTFNRDDSPIALRNTATVVIAATKFMKAISPGRSRKPTPSSPLVPSGDEGGEREVERAEAEGADVAGLR